MKKPVKMHTHVVAISDTDLTCFERPISAYLHWKGYPCDFLGLSEWTFTYNYVKNYKGIAANPPMMNICECITKFTGIRLDIKTIDDSTKACNAIKSHICKNEPVMVYIDSFYCPWYPSYYISHINHYVLITGYDDEINSFFCVDRDDGIDIKYISYKDYISGRTTQEVVFFKPEMIPLPSRRDIVEYIKSQIVLMDLSNMFDNILGFSQFVSDELDLDEEMKHVHDFRVASIYTWLKGIATSRKKFANSIQRYIPTPEIVAIADEIRGLSGKWMNILLLLISKYQKNDSDYSYISDYIRWLACDEKAVSAQLFGLLTQPTYEE